MQSMPYYQQGYQNPSPYPPTFQNPVNAIPMPNPTMLESAGQLAGTTTKRKQVKNACTNCQKACKKCDESRPCPRCLKYGIADTCVNSTRKERKKGIKRGPYKRRQNKQVSPMNNADTKLERPHPDGMNPGNPPGADRQDQQANSFNAAQPNMRSAIPFSYSNMNQYNQPYDHYGSYPYHKDQVMHQPYMMGHMYQQVSYPVLVPGGETHANQAHSQYAPSNMAQQYGSNVVNRQQQQSRPMPMHPEHSVPSQTYYRPQQMHPNDRQDQGMMPPKRPQQPLTPLPSHSTSSAASTPESAADPY